MQIRYHRENGAEIVYDAERMTVPSSALFDPQYWEARAALVGQAAGRGTTWFVHQGDEQWALRHYRRGGLVAKLVTDHYLWLGLARSRAWREWHLTADLCQRGLPVPTPVAARVIRHGASYRADLITVRIPGAIALSQHLRESALDAGDWQRIGVMLARFHAAGVDHADLNAHNILLDPLGGFWLIDFDRARIRDGSDWRAQNLQRLQRSLKKLRVESARFLWSDADWAVLRAGYESHADG